MKAPNEKEVHKEIVDRELPTIVYQKTTRQGMTNQEEIYIKVSDKTSDKALKTFEKIKAKR